MLGRGGRCEPILALYQTLLQGSLEALTSQGVLPSEFADGSLRFQGRYLAQWPKLKKNGAL